MHHEDEESLLVIHSFGTENRKLESPHPREQNEFENIQKFAMNIGKKKLRCFSLF